MELETTRLILKALQAEHADLVLQYHLSNRAFVQEWSPIRKEEFFTLEYHQKNLEQNVSDHLLRLFLFKKDNPSTVIGDIGYSNIVRGAFQSCHLGYSMLFSELNSGFITEALEVSNRYVFDTMGLHRIEANVMPKNLPSIKVLEKLGFENEGLRKTYLKINGQWEDHLSFVKFSD
ncbi:MAG: GNAT family N-acetyltransferase [Bacteroidetes bacterium]|nr:GNAT family N-acetyltransferase [Bacteroidota bacterium]